MGPLSAAERDATYKIVANPHMTAAEKAKAIAAIQVEHGIARANAQAEALRAMPQMMGPLGGVGDTHLRPELAPRVPTGAARPYAPGEYTINPDTSWSSERSMTVQKPDGSWTVIPSLWLKEGHPYEAADEGEASKLADASKLPFKKFKSLKEADQFSIDREAAWQPIENPADASSIAPLWEPQK